jgi:hypothetical protein
MRAVLCAVLILTACRIDLDHGVDAGDGRACKVSTAPTCMDATTHSDFAWIEQKIFLANCFGSSCHGDSTASGKIDLSEGHSYAALMGPTGMGGVKSDVDPTRDLVVPFNPAKSYLFLMIRGVAPADADPPASPPPVSVGFMPMANAALCCQKIDVVERWITAGAANN